LDLVKAFEIENDEEIIDLEGDKSEILKLALNDYINTRVNAIS